MSKKMAPDEMAWKAKKDAQIIAEYEGYLESESAESSPENAHLFALKKIQGGFDYMGYKERDLIIMLAGSLPVDYD